MANSTWIKDCVGRWVEATAASLLPDAPAAARTHGQVGNMAALVAQIFDKQDTGVGR